MSTASKVAQAKIDFPQDFCPEPRCLWRTWGGYCPRHKPQHSGQFISDLQDDVARIQGPTVTEREACEFCYGEGKVLAGRSDSETCYEVICDCRKVKP